MQTQNNGRPTGNDPSEIIVHYLPMATPKPMKISVGCAVN